MWDFHKVNNFVAVGEKDELINVVVRRSKVKTTNKHFARHFITYIQNAEMYFNETYRSQLLITRYS